MTDRAPGQPEEDDGSVFREPWEAQAFALTLALHRRGLFCWAEWTQALARQIDSARSAGTPERADTYYRHWLAALETLLALKGASSPEELLRYHRAWERAAHRTPHGQPIDLASTDFAATEAT